MIIHPENMAMAEKVADEAIDFLTAQMAQRNCQPGIVLLGALAAVVSVDATCREIHPHHVKTDHDFLERLLKASIDIYWAKNRPDKH